MTREERLLAVDYLSRHMERPPLPIALRRLSDEALSETGGSHDGMPKYRGRRRASGERRPPGTGYHPTERVRKRADGRIVRVRERKRPLRERILLTVVVVLSALLLVGATYVLTAWSPTLNPIAVTTLVPSSAAGTAHGVTLHGRSGTLVIATDLPSPASGFHYVAWDETQDVLSRLGAMARVAPGTYRIETRRRTTGVVRVTIERVGDRNIDSGPVMLEGLTSP